MVKECLVILNNDLVTVARFDDKDIQFPSVRKDVKKVFVNYENGRYSIVDENFKSESAQKAKTTKKKSAAKKTTVKQED
jgi:hypothetical protein